MNIFDAAEYFISKVDEESGEVITHLKLQKLCYYAQAWHLAIHDKVLFNSRFEAWAHGPVNPELFQSYRVYSYDPIPFPESFDLEKYSADDKAFLDDVWNVYGKYDAKYLERLTHQEKPWTEARGNLPEGASCNRELSIETMKTYYRGLLEQ